MKLVGCAAAVGLAACGGGIATDLEGIYTIETWTDNPVGCASEGPTILPSQPEAMFFVRAESYFGTDFVNVDLCADPTACEAAAASAAIEFDGWAFDRGSDADGWRGGQATAGGDGTTCTGSASDDTLTATAAGAVRIESRRRVSRPFSPDADGLCSTDDAIAAASGEPCAELAVVTARRVAPLP